MAKKSWFSRRMSLPKLLKLRLLARIIDESPFLSSWTFVPVSIQVRYTTLSDNFYTCVLFTLRVPLVACINSSEQPGKRELNGCLIWLGVN